MTLSLPADAICLLNFSLSVGEMPTACPAHPLAGTKPTLSNFLTPVLMYLFWKTRLPLTSEEHIALFFLAFSFAPNCFVLVLVLRSTPSVSTLVAESTFSFLLPYSCPSIPPSVIDSFKPFSSTSLLIDFETFRPILPALCVSPS